MEKKFITASVVKAELITRSGLETISSEAIDWVNSQVSAILDTCVATGRRTPGGRLMAPPASATPVAVPAVPANP
jgi:hypothetical protein